MRPSKFDILAKELELMISSRKLTAGNQLPSQSHIVKQFKVSRSCVNKALNHLHKKGLISKIPGKGNFVFSDEKAPKEVKRLLYLVESNMLRSWTGYDDYGFETMCGIEEECRNRKIGFGLRSVSPEEYENLPLIVKELDIDGVIARYTIPEEQVRAIASMKLPVVYIDIPFYAPDIGCSMINYYDAYITLVEKLESNGIRKVTFFYPETSKYGLEIRNAVNTVQNIYPKLKIRNADFSVPRVPYNANLDMEMITAAVKKIISSKTLPEVFICNTDYIAEKLMKALKENGLTVPSNVQIIGGLGLNFAQKTIPPLSTLIANAELLGRNAVEILCAMAKDNNNEKIKRIPMFYKNGGTCILH